MTSKELSMNRKVQNERGMALAVAIFALVIVGALVAGAMFAGTQEQRVGESTRRLEQSFGVAELGVYDVVRSWDPGTYNQARVYPFDSVALPNGLAPGTTPSRTGSYGGYVYHLNDNLYLIDVTGHDTVSGTNYGGGRARQRVGLLASIRTLQIATRASLTTQNGNLVMGNSAINGFDQVPPGWAGCGPLDTARAGIRMDKGDTVKVMGSATIVGNPPVKVDSTVNDSTFSTFGDVTYSQLAARANVTLPSGTYTHIDPVTTNGVCDKTNLSNWGDGQNQGQPCSGYFPIIHITGSAAINGDQGQGILLVDNNLTVNGSFQFFGIVIVRGTVNTAGGGSTDAHFYGMVMAQDSVTLGDNTITGHANLNYSKCAIMRALDNTGVVTPMRSRSWVQLF